LKNASCPSPNSKIPAILSPPFFPKPFKIYSIISKGRERGEGMEWQIDPATWGTLAAGVLLGAASGWLLFRRKPAGNAGEGEKLQTLREACRLSRDAILVIGNERILFANPAAEKLGEIREDSSLRSTEEHLNFYDPEEGEWLGLADLLERHRKNRASQSTLFRNLQLAGRSGPRSPWRSVPPHPTTARNGAGGITSSSSMTPAAKSSCWTCAISTP
jgi:PAS domain-containing protein